MCKKRRGNQDWCEDTGTKPSGKGSHFSESVLHRFCLRQAEEVYFVLEKSPVQFLDCHDVALLVA